MKTQKFRSVLFNLTGVLVIGLFTTAPAVAQVADAAATGLDVLATTDTPLVGVEIDITEAQVDMVDSAAFDDTDQVLDLNVAAGAITADVLTAHIQHQPALDQVDGDASVANLSIVLGLLGISLADLSSTTIASAAQVAGSCDNLAATGSTVIEDLSLSVLGQVVASNLTVSPAPNTELLNTNIVIDLGGSTLSASALVILNEQSVSGDQSSITVNAVRISVDIAVTGITNLSQTLDIVISRSEAAFSVCPLADLAVVKTDDPDPVGVNGLLTYTLTVTNNGPDDATMTQLVDTLDPTVVFVSATPSQGACMEAALVVTCDLGTIPNQGNATVIIEIIPSAVGQITNEVVVDSEIGDPNLDDNTDVEVTTVEAAPATFLVTKNFSDDNPGEVEVTISCNTGLPLMQTHAISEGDPVNFVVGDFESGSMDCEVSESVPMGYSQSYASGGDSGNSSDDEGCYFTAVEGNHANQCDITNDLEPVDVIVYKEWIDDHPEYQLPTWVFVTVYCNAPIVFEVSTNGDLYSVSGYIQPGSPGSVHVLPHWDGTSYCYATEEPEAGVIQDVSDCEFIPLAPGMGGECTIVNTRLFAGIPTLNRIGMIVLILLVLGMGLLTVRRLI